MAEIITAAVEVATGRFITDGRDIDGVTVIRVEVPENPDEKRERYSGDPKNPIRPATDEEQLEHVEIIKTEAAQRSLVESREIRAVLNVGLRGRLGRTPTPQQIADEEAAYVETLKALQ